MGAGGGPRAQWRPEAWEKPWVGLPLAREELPVPRSRSPRPAASHRAPTVRDRGRPAAGRRPGGSADLRWRRGTRRASCELHARLCCPVRQQEEENGSEPQRRRHGRRSRATRSNGAVTRERGASREGRGPPRGITGNKGVRGRGARREGGGAPLAPWRAARGGRSLARQRCGRVWLSSPATLGLPQRMGDLGWGRTLGLWLDVASCEAALLASWLPSWWSQASACTTQPL